LMGPAPYRKCPSVANEVTGKSSNKAAGASHFKDATSIRLEQNFIQSSCWFTSRFALVGAAKRNRTQEVAR